MKIWKMISLAFIGVFGVALSTVSATNNISEVKGSDLDEITYAYSTDSLLLDYDDFDDMKKGQDNHSLLTTARGYKLNYLSRRENGIVPQDDKVTTKFVGKKDNEMQTPEFDIFYYPGMEIKNITITVPDPNPNGGELSKTISFGGHLTSNGQAANPIEVFLYKGTQSIEFSGNQAITSPFFSFDRYTCTIVSIKIDFIKTSYRCLHSNFNNELTLHTYDVVSYECNVYGFPEKTKFSIVPREGGATFDLDHDQTKFFYDQGLLRVRFYIGSKPGRLQWDIVVDLPSGNQMKFAESYHDDVIDQQISIKSTYDYDAYYTECTYLYDAIIPPFFGDILLYNPYELEWKLSDPSAFTTKVEENKIKITPKKVGTYTLQLVANFTENTAKSYSNIITLEVKDIKENPYYNKKFTPTDIDNGLPLLPGKSIVHGIIYAYHIYDEETKYLEFILANPLDGKGILVKTNNAHGEYDRYVNQYAQFKNCIVNTLPSGDIYLEGDVFDIGLSSPWHTNRINYRLFDRNVRNAAFDIISLNGVEKPGDSNSQLLHEDGFTDEYERKPDKMMTIKYFTNPYRPSGSPFLQVNDPDLKPGDISSFAIKILRQDLNELATSNQTRMITGPTATHRLALTFAMPLSDTRTIPVWQVGEFDKLEDRFYNVLDMPESQITRSCLESYPVVKDMYFHFETGPKLDFQQNKETYMHDAYDRYMTWAKFNGDPDPLLTNRGSPNNHLITKDEHYIVLAVGLITMFGFVVSSIVIIKRHKTKKIK